MAGSEAARHHTYCCLGSCLGSCLGTESRLGIFRGALGADQEVACAVERLVLEFEIEQMNIVTQVYLKSL